MFGKLNQLIDHISKRYLYENDEFSFNLFLYYSCLIMIIASLPTFLALLFIRAPCKYNILVITILINSYVN